MEPRRWATVRGGGANKTFCAVAVRDRNEQHWTPGRSWGSLYKQEERRLVHNGNSGHDA